MTAKIIFRHLLLHPLSTLLSIVLLTCGTGIISLLLMAQHQLENKFGNDLKDIDLVIGAKGSPLQLVLSAVYQMDAPTGNIPLADAEKIARNPLVEQAIPLAYGDSYHSFRIVGTDSNYLAKYNARFREGHIFSDTLDAVIGSQAAVVTGLKPGNTFVGTHGLGNTGHTHAGFKYKVTGILAESNTVIDNLVLTNVATVWAIHAHHHHDHNHDANDYDADEDEKPQQLTAMLLKYRSPLAMIALPRMINETTGMQAAVPALEIKRLFSLMGIGIKTMQAIAFTIVLLSGLSVFIALYTRLKERKYELALARSMGSSRLRISFFLLSEGLLLVLVGFMAGILLSRIGLWMLDKYSGAKYHIRVFKTGLLPEELYLLAGTLLLGILAAAIPALKAFYLNISKTLANE